MKTTMMKGARRAASAGIAAMLGLALSGCATGPQVVKPLLHLDEEGGVHYDKSYQVGQELNAYVGQAIARVKEVDRPGGVGFRSPAAKPGSECTFVMRNDDGREFNPDSRSRKRSRRCDRLARIFRRFSGCMSAARSEHQRNQRCAEKQCCPWIAFDQAKERKRTPASEC